LARLQPSYSFTVSGSGNLGATFSGVTIFGAGTTNGKTGQVTWTTPAAQATAQNYSIVVTFDANTTINESPATVTIKFSVAGAPQPPSDSTAPQINCTVPDQTIWYGADVTVNCTASDSGSGLANAGDANFSLATSVAAGTETASAVTNSKTVCDKASPANCATAGPYTFKVDKKAPVVSCGSADGVWHGSDVSIACRASDGGSGLVNDGDASFNLSTSVTANTEDANASTNSYNVADGVGNSATAGPISGNKVDKKAPTVSCGSADGNWHGSDVSIACTASDAGSGLVNPADARFSLSTSVPADTEDANASTGTHAVGDAVGNSATAGPISGNKVDKKGPIVTCAAAPTFLLNQSDATVSATVTDGGSGAVASPVSASVPTSAVGSQTASVTGYDKVGNRTTQSCSYRVNYRFDGFLQPINDTAHTGLTMSVFKAGSTIPVKFQLKDANGVPVQASSAITWMAPVNMGATTAAIDESSYSDPASSVSYYRWDSTSQQYILQLGHVEEPSQYPLAHRPQAR